ncbi:bifunctional [glutamate--ammonia ligase]-adenylyl-L-tyrosine phosphorylase/[glutamate--ammonia-ligase] adenylyltransferase [Pararobbsia silviterrae]|uniref:Bifunctional glutamine synthetase adenylyltransferase/adenylyl-removing enzyme n=1 Tax=Pararobbsia silviterrae TaxID=1792498 RepID=A0A494XKE1_9BURK|nr:bifunctional [glutamate--ammonia ligase]-adenylyl-L-tyrosine phosphorylase/[glutamate--ammonia-ligase] adenylyltransferase [Pararobbsia silviterrae]RKP48619.1 bifunctional [glutamate--ammonia ligase]-adenylyl-L-tyrosine phosphorylase/[glutamate--ammonia-ligase] adenylyltransferase [Pararobbsia silviterrae]
MTDTPPLCVSFSTYATRVLHANPDFASRLPGLAEAPVTRAWMEDRLAELGVGAAPAAWPDEDALKRALRRLRAEVYLIVMERDLAGAADVAEVTGAMTDLAEIAIQRALDVIDADLRATFGAPLAQTSGAPLSLGVVGMGKLGGRELNVSSDIDLIFVYEEEGETAGGQRKPLSNHEYFTRLGRRLIGALSELTADGFVFRVDMRLRPNGDSGALVSSLGMLEEYFYVQGREWERYAWIKGRLVSRIDEPSGAHLAGELDRLVKPFVYRRYLDFNVIGALRSLHEQIRREASKRATMRPEKADDIKLGRGGIREIEFSAQVFQLIRGGQDAGFRVRPTLEVLAHAVARGLLSASVAAQLSDAYLFFRRVEHRLQYADDAQTHALPVDPDARARLAASLGHVDYASLLDEINRHRALAEAQFDRIFADKNGNGSTPAGTVPPNASPAAFASAAGAAAASVTSAMTTQDARESGKASESAQTVQTSDPASTANTQTQPFVSGADLWNEGLLDDEVGSALATQAARLGFADAKGMLARLQAVRGSTRYSSLSERSRERFDLLVVRVLDAAPSLPADHCDAIVLRFLDLLESVARRGAYLALLAEYPAALMRVLSVIGASRWAAGYLQQHPQLLDELLDDEALAAPSDWTVFKQSLARRLAHADSVEQQLDLLRHAQHAETFRILLLDLAAHITVERISDLLSELADAVVEVTLEAVWRQLPRRHRDAPRFAVIAYGKLGGKELGYASDLDLIFLYDDPDENADEIYAMFARRLITWLTTATGAGALYDVDLRLRPNGSSGLLVTSLDAFRRYQLHEGDGSNTAWVWEHQALSRARFACGDPRLGEMFEDIRTQVLTQHREALPLAREIVAMRERVHEGHPNRSALFDLKHDRGGMVDVEFTVQYLVLLHASGHPELLRNTGNIALLRELAHFGLMPESEAEAVGNAYRRYRAIQHKMRLDGMDAARVPAETVEVEKAAVEGLWDRIFAGVEPAPLGAIGIER